MRAGDVGPTARGIILWKRFEYDLTLEADQQLHFLCALKDSPLIWIANVHRIVLVALGESKYSIDQI